MGKFLLFLFPFSFREGELTLFLQHLLAQARKISAEYHPYKKRKRDQDRAEATRLVSCPAISALHTLTFPL